MIGVMCRLITLTFDLPGTTKDVVLPGSIHGTIALRGLTKLCMTLSPVYNVCEPMDDETEMTLVNACWSYDTIELLESSMKV